MREIINNRITMIKDTIKEMQASYGGDWFELKPLSHDTYEDRIFVIEDFVKNLDVSRIVLDMYEDRCARNNIPVDHENLVYGKHGIFGCVFSVHDLVFPVDSDGEPMCAS